jgi:four helix bundle protein
MVRKNMNRGYMQLHVWQDALEYYRDTSPVFRAFPYELKRVASQQISCVDSIHRNIAEGYGRRSLKEYLQFLNVALASAAESVSGLHVFHAASQIDDNAFETLDARAYKIENGLKKLIESLQQKQQDGIWEDHFIVRESNASYGSPNVPAFQHSTSPTVP